MNWGKGIVGGMVVFILFILGMCIYMFKMPEDEYDHQYYEKGLNFNQEYIKEQQVKKDHAWPSVYILQNRLKLAFVLPATGTVKFLRSSSSSLDKTFKFRQSGSEEVNIPIEKLLKGKWKLEIEWVSNQKSYLYKQDIFIR